MNSADRLLSLFWSMPVNRVPQSYSFSTTGSTQGRNPFVLVGLLLLILPSVFTLYTLLLLLGE
jgi:hypothetical protein